MLVAFIALVAVVFVIALVAVSVKIVLDDKADKARARRNHDFKVNQHFANAEWDHIRSTKWEAPYNTAWPSVIL